jgi:hypothetical protein
MDFATILIFETTLCGPSRRAAGFLDVRASFVDGFRNPKSKAHLRKQRHLGKSHGRGRDREIPALLLLVVRHSFRIHRLWGFGQSGSGL